MAASREGVSRELARLRHLGLLTLARVRWVSNFSAYCEATASSACARKEASAAMAETDRKQEMVFRMKSFSSVRFEAHSSCTDAGSDFLEAARHSCAEKIFLLGHERGDVISHPQSLFGALAKGASCGDTAAVAGALTRLSGGALRGAECCPFVAQNRYRNPAVTAGWLDRSTSGLFLMALPRRVLLTSTNIHCRGARV